MRKTLPYFFIVFLALSGVCFGAGAVSYEHVLIKGFSVDVVSADLKDPRVVVTPVVSKKFPNEPESFEKIVSRETPTAAINGNFFCKDTFRPVGDLVVDGELNYFGGLGTAMAITENNKVEFIKVEKNRHMNWSGYKAVISCGPRLLEDGKIKLNPGAEGFKDPSLFSARNRSAVGITYDNRLLFVSVNSPVYFQDLADVMKELGCKDAMNLDGGSSSGLYYKGAMLRNPSTPLPDILVVNEQQHAPNVLVALGNDLTKGEKRIVILSSFAMVLDNDKFAVKDAKDGKVLLLMKFESPQFVESPQLGAKFAAADNKITFEVPFEKIKEALQSITPESSL